MGVLDVVGVRSVPRQRPAQRPRLGVLAACSDRRAYSAVFTWPSRLDFDGRASELAARGAVARHARLLYERLADVTGREVDQIRADARQERLLTVDQAIAYGLIQGPAEPRQPCRRTPAGSQSRSAAKPRRHPSRPCPRPTRPRPRPRPDPDPDPDPG